MSPHPTQPVPLPADAGENVPTALQDAARRIARQLGVSENAVLRGWTPSNGAHILPFASEPVPVGGENAVLTHQFQAWADACDVCKALDGTRVSEAEWNEEKHMKELGFWKQADGMYRPHPNCKCAWGTPRNPT